MIYGLWRQARGNYLRGRSHARYHLYGGGRFRQYSKYQGYYKIRKESRPRSVSGASKWDDHSKRHKSELAKNVEEILEIVKKRDEKLIS